jgi:hypothetical protein
MKTLITISALFLVACLASTALCQTTTSNIKTKNTMKPTMNTYVIEREIPNAGTLTSTELQGIAQKSCAVIKELGPDIDWVQSYVTDNKIFCIYRAESEEILRTHAMKGGFPINSVHLLSTVISPATATAELAEIR